MKKILFFDTETSGLPKNYHAPAIDTDSWPRMIQFGYILADFNRSIIEKGAFLIQPNGFEIPYSATAVHHITTERAKNEGIPISEALDRIQKLAANVELLVGHNVDFDIHVVDAEFYRMRQKLCLSTIPYICTMTSSTSFCNLPNNKWPRLTELYRKLFGCSMRDAHDALNDVSATYKCFWELLDKNVISLEESSEKSEIPAEISTTEKSKFNADKISDFTTLNWFRFKLKQTNLNSTIEEQEIFLSDFYLQNEENFCKQELTDFQQSFIDDIYSQYISKYPEIFDKNDSKEKKFTYAIGIGYLDYMFGLSKNKDFRKAVIEKYYNILAEEYLPRFTDYIIQKQKFEYTSSTSIAFTDYVRFEKERLAFLDQNNNPLASTSLIAPICNTFGPQVRKLKENGISDLIYPRIVSDTFIGILRGSLLVLNKITGMGAGLLPGVNDTNTLQNALSALENIKEQVPFPNEEMQEFDKYLEEFRQFIPKKKKFRLW